jgi:hypothetical protein
VHRVYSEVSPSGFACVFSVAGEDCGSLTCKPTLSLSLSLFLVVVVVVVGLQLSQQLQ